MTVRVEHADMLEAIPRLVGEGVVVDAVVTDPPYHLLPTSSRFGPGQKPAGDVEDGRYHRLAGGFMGQVWDGGNIAFRPETWATVATIMRPGAFLVAFGGTRTHHRVWCAIEDAGFVIQDTIMWMFGTGFPKRRDMLKPAFEPIVLAYKPGGKRTMQVDECRIGTTVETWPATRSYVPGGKQPNALGTYTVPTSDAPPGRWPANLCHDGSDEVLAALPDRGPPPGNTHSARQHGGGVFGGGRIGIENIFKDTGSAARFFFSAKAGSQDRWGSRHPTVKPVELMKWLVPLVCPPGDLVLDPFAGSGTTGVAALATGRNAILIEREATYIADIRERMGHYEGDGRHSLASKARNAPDKPLGGLFA